MNTEQSPTANAPDPQRPWSAHEVAAFCGRSVDWAWSALVRWRDAGLVEQVGKDSITGAALYPPEQVRAAFEIEHDGPPSEA